jgi:lipid A 3-O-deacylase
VSETDLRRFAEPADRNDLELKMKTMSKAWRIVAGVVCFAAGGAQAQWFDQGAVLTVTEENDIVATTDRHYTQGFKLAYLLEDNCAPAWLDRAAAAVPTWGYTPHAIKIGMLVGQSIYTPSDLQASLWNPNDRPYAGWLYAGFLLQRRGLTAAGRPLLESCQLELGVVGPPSLAEDAQVWAHENPPKGWSHQLNTEPGFALKYLRACVISAQREGPRTLDFIPHAGFSLGNIDTSLRLGATVRVGVNLPDDFGLQPINSLATTEGGLAANHGSGRWGFYVFGGVEGRAVGYNEFLNGNLFRDDRHHVTPEPLVAQLSAGVALTYARFEIGASGVWTTDEFKGQDHPNTYGGLFLKVKL